MQVANRELCKELYKLSGWEDTQNTWKRLRDLNDAKWRDWFLADYNNAVRDSLGEQNFPAYDLGYLLRKLPEEIGRTMLVLVPGDRPYVGYAERDNYGNYTLDEYFYKNAEYALTSEDAAAKLAIQLFKQGILTPNTESKEAI